MCGLCAILALDGAPVPRDVLVAMSAALIHRGPDRGAEVISGPCGLANRRLAVPDLSADAALPMCSADGAITLAPNGEIYNYPDLRRTLEAASASLRSHGARLWTLLTFERWHRLFIDLPEPRAS